MGGLIIVFGIYYAPYVYMFTASALRNMDPSLEEAAEVAGATRAAHLFTVTFPLIAPAILSGMLLSFIVMLGIYGIPAVLGAPGQHPGAHHLHLQAHRLVAAALQHGRLRRDHADGGDRRSWCGAAAGRCRGAATPPWPARRSGRALLNLGPWRWFTLRAGHRLPVRRGGAADAGADHRGVPQVPVHQHFASLFDERQYSLVHFERLFDNPLAMRSIWNTMEVGVHHGDGRRRVRLRHRLHGQPHQRAGPQERSTSSRRCPSPFPAWSSASPTCGPGSACRAASTARSGSWRWRSSPASCPTP